MFINKRSLKRSRKRGKAAGFKRQAQWKTEDEQGEREGRCVMKCDSLSTQWPFKVEGVPFFLKVIKW